MARSLLDNLPALSWSPDEFVSIDGPEPTRYIAHCPLTKMTFRMRQAKSSVRVTSESPEGRAEARYDDVGKAETWARESRLAALMSMLPQPRVEIGIAPLTWSKPTGRRNALVAMCPVTGTAFSIRNTPNGFVGAWPEAPKTPAGSAQELREAAESWRKARILPHITTGPAPADASAQMDHDAIVWVTRDGEEMKMSEIEDTHLEHIIRHLENRKQAAEDVAAVSGGALLTDMRAEVDSLSAKLDLFTAEAEKRGISDEPDAEIPF